METTRYPYLVNKAFLNILMASLLSTMAMQLATSIGVMIAGNFVSPDAVSVINLTMPMTTFIAATHTLFGIGASYRISRLLGSNDQDSVQRVFSSTLVVVVVLGLAISSLILVFHQTIAHLLTSDARLSDMLSDYLSVFAFQPFFFMLTIFFVNCVKSVGNAHIALKSTLIGTVIEVITALTAVRVFDMGIKGIALAACVDLAVQAALFLWLGVRPSAFLNKFTFRFNIVMETWENMKLSFPMFISMVLTGTVLLAINNVVAAALGIDGLNILSVCIQLMLLTVMLMVGINSAMMPIGNMMMGEGDYDGARLLNTTVMKTVAFIFAPVFVLIMIFPSTVLQLFGLDVSSVGDHGMYALRVYDFTLPLLAYSMLRMTRLMFLSYTKLASFSATLRIILMFAAVALIVHVAPQHLWWGFPLSNLMSESVMTYLSYRIHRRTPGTDPLTLIPKASGTTVWSSSLPYDMQSLSVILSEVEEFFSKSQADGSTIRQLMLTTEELASNIIKFAQKGKASQRFDIFIRSMDDKFVVSLKDDGKPFNPIKKDGHHTLITESFPDLLNATIGLKIVNNIGLHLEYRYMYGQNIVNILGFRTRPTGASSGR